MKDQEIIKHINQISLKDWNRLFDLIPKIQTTLKFGEWKGGKQESGDVFILPSVIEDKIVFDFIEIMYELELVIDFNWPEWHEGRKIASNSDFNNLSTITLLKLLTSFIRNNRFCEGALVGRFEDKTIEKILIELKRNILIQKHKERKMDLKELKKKYNTEYKDLSLFAEKARLLQSIWRTEKGLKLEPNSKYGNYIKEDLAKQNASNFLTENIFEIVKYEVINKHKNRKVIQEPRIWNNLLSSQPLAFNLFGELSLNAELATKVFKELYPERNIKNIIKIKFEYSPDRGDTKYTGDKSAFDVFIKYENNENNENKKGFFGIEVKYAETLNDKPSKDKPIYTQISEKSDIFDMSKINELKEKPIQQIWRDHLLALSLFITNNDYTVGDFIFLYPKDNINCVIAITKYNQTFKRNTENYFRPLTMELLTETIKKFCKDDWINEFENRYLRFDKIEKL